MYSKRLEDVATADQIRALKDLPMIRFESEVWKAFGENYINREDRRRVSSYRSTFYEFIANLFFTGCYLLDLYFIHCSYHRQVRTSKL